MGDFAMESKRSADGLLANTATTRRHVEGEGFPGTGGQAFVWQQVILGEKDQAGSQGRAFVAVEEGVVAAKIEEIGRGDLSGRRTSAVP